MLTPFDTISENARLWIYSAEKQLSDTQEEYIKTKLGEYLKNWEYHQNPLTAAITILEHHFVIVALDDVEFGVGGCSIDALQKVIQNLERDLNISLFNRMQIFCKVGEEIKCYPAMKLKEYAHSDSLFYDLTIPSKKELKNYLKPIKEGWCKRFL